MSGSFQQRVQPWLDACFGRAIAVDRVERNDRFIEEALELVQASGGEAARCHALVDYVFNRPIGDQRQEVGGVMNTLAALCLAHGLDMDEAAEAELARVWTKVEAIREKQKAKPTGSALPVAPSGTHTALAAAHERVRVLPEALAQVARVVPEQRASWTLHPVGKGLGKVLDQLVPIEQRIAALVRAALTPGPHP